MKEIGAKNIRVGFVEATQINSLIENHARRNVGRSLTEIRAANYPRGQGLAEKMKLDGIGTETIEGACNSRMGGARETTITSPLSLSAPWPAVTLIQERGVGWRKLKANAQVKSNVTKSNNLRQSSMFLYIYRPIPSLLFQFFDANL